MIEPDRIREIIAGGENLTVEFKGEEHVPLSDQDLVEAVVCLANGQGGILLIGVEDDGRVIGARPHDDYRPLAPTLPHTESDRAGSQQSYSPSAIRRALPIDHRGASF